MICVDQGQGLSGVQLTVIVRKRGYLIACTAQNGLLSALVLTPSHHTLLTSSFFSLASFFLLSLLSLLSK